MNRLKVATEALHDYLGKDAHGRNLLKKVTDVANEQRKRCAFLEESATEARRAYAKQRQDLDAAHIQIEQLKAELIREKATRESAEHRERVLLEKIEAMRRPPEPVPPENLVAAVSWLLRSVRRQYKTLPGNTEDGRYLLVENFVKEFREWEFMMLGKVVALCAWTGYPVQIVADYIAANDFSAEDGRLWLDWMASRVEPTRADELIAEFTGAHGWKHRRAILRTLSAPSHPGREITKREEDLLWLALTLLRTQRERLVEALRKPDDPTKLIIGEVLMDVPTDKEIETCLGMWMDKATIPHVEKGQPHEPAESCS